MHYRYRRTDGRIDGRTTYGSDSCTYTVNMTTVGTIAIDIIFVR